MRLIYFRPLLTLLFFSSHPQNESMNVSFPRIAKIRKLHGLIVSSSIPRKVRKKDVCTVVSEKHMDIKTLLHNLREEVSCPVCTNVYTDPKHLPCLHTFCLQCLKHTTSHGRDTFRCPKCQAISKVAISKIFPPVSQRRFWRDNHTIWRLQGKCWMLLKCHALRPFIFFLKTNQTKNLQ